MKQLITPLVLLCTLTARTQDFTTSQTFGNSGDILLELSPGLYEAASSHAICPDGKSLFGGFSYDSGPNTFHATLVRLDPACGTLDYSLGGTGFVKRTFEQRTLLRGLAVQPDGCIVGCGMIAPGNGGGEQWPGIFRLYPNGDVDSTFNGTGYHRLPFAGDPGVFFDVFINADSTITCTGSGDNFHIGAYRFRYDGSLDTTFGNNGEAVMTLPNYYTGAGCGLLLPDSSVISIDLIYSGNGNSRVIAMSKFDHAGDPDTTFGNAGLLVSNVAGSASVGYPTTRLHAALQADGKILVSSVGDGDLNCSMARFLPNGDPDISYGTDGLSLVAVGTNKGEGMALLPDGSTLQFGSNGANGILLKRDPDGQVVSTFGDNGVISTVNGDPNGRRVHGGFLLPDGRLIGYGASHVSLYVTRFTTDAPADALPVISAVDADLVTTGTGAMQWFLDGAPISGATGNSYTPTENGDYTVEMTVTADCIYTSPVYTLLNVGVVDQASSSFRVMSNPVAEVLVVMNDGANIPYEVIGMNGKRIASGTLLSGRNAIDLSGAASGIYLLRATTVDGVKTLRIVKR